MVLFDSNPRIRPWWDPAHLRLFGGPGVRSQTQRTSISSCSPLPPPSPSPSNQQELADPEAVAFGRAQIRYWLKPYNLGHPNLAPGLFDDMWAYVDKLEELARCDIQDIFGDSANDFQRRIRAELVHLGFERHVLETWNCFDEDEPVDDGFDPENFIDELSDQEI